ncbi:MAG: hypothetical protein RBT02_06625 [Bacteroidales bacterium]|jgi:hypothetical protein|nr:hypothetical protein [Bacteroidales bacterium]
MDFTTSTFSALISTLKDSGYSLMPFESYISMQPDNAVILRHDVDRRPGKSLKTAEIENRLGVRGTYYFRAHPDSFDISVIRQIAGLGHEIGYHYEDLTDAVKKTKDKRQKRFKPGIRNEEELVKIALDSFRGNLNMIRQIVPVKTICMHGSPLSKWDSRLLWKYYDYRDLGIVAEPYFDVNLDNLLYLTDTGRRWDGDSVSIRDKGLVAREGYYNNWKVKPVTGSALSMTSMGAALRSRHLYRSTYDIKHALDCKAMPSRLMITLHPQRWSGSFPEWIAEFLGQNMKNQVKYFMIKSK